MSELLRVRCELFFHAGWEMLCAFAPYVVGGALLGALLASHRRGRSSRIAARLSGVPTAWGIVLAVAIGLGSPFCTYGTVPIVGALLRAGLSPAPAVAFLSASSLMNPQLFVITAGGLGIEIALVRLAGAALMAALCGAMVALLGARGRAFIRSADGESAAPDEGADGSALTTPIRPCRRVVEICVRTLRELEWLGPWLLAGILIAAAARVFVPPSVITSVLGAENPYATAIATAAGMPFYACGGAAVPLLAELSRQGVSDGVILAFLWSGPALRITALAAIGAVFRLRFVAAYAAYAALAAFAFGSAVSFFTSR